MVEGSGRKASFPVFFFNGDRETNVGDVEIHPEMEYKPFQLMLSQMIGISPNQISTYLVSRKKSSGSPLSGDRKRIPITSKVDFGSVCCRKECWFLAVLKRSRKPRNRKGTSPGGGVEFSPIILSGDRGAKTLNGAIARPETCGPCGRLRSFIGGFMDPPILNWGHNLHPDFGYVVNLNQWEIDSGDPFCEECWTARRMVGTASFHPCVKDPVITRFTTRLGPINKPNSPLQ